MTWNRTARKIAQYLIGRDRRSFDGPTWIDMEQEASGPLTSWIAVVLFESSFDKPGNKPLYEESFILIRATNEDAAAAKAEAFARSRQVKYLNEQGDAITWTFKKLIDVSPMLDDELIDGSELYARHFYNYSAYEQFELLLSDDK